MMKMGCTCAAPSAAAFSAALSCRRSPCHDTRIAPRPGRAQPKTRAAGGRRDTARRDDSHPVCESAGAAEHAGREAGRDFDSLSASERALIPAYLAEPDDAVWLGHVDDRATPDASHGGTGGGAEGRRMPTLHTATHAAERERVRRWGRRQHGTNAVCHPRSSATGRACRRRRRRERMVRTTTTLARW